MTETDRFHEVDRHAWSARAALDAAVADAAVPDLPDARRPSSRPHRPILVAAAAVVIVALAGAALLASGGRNQSTVAGQPETTYLVLRDPHALGLELAAAFDGTEPAPAASSGSHVLMTVQAAADADDPWASSVVEYSLPAEATTMSGEAVDIGGPEATVSSSGVAPTVSWVDGDRVRFLLSQHVPEAELVDLARRAAASGTMSGAPLPGHTTLFAGTAFDVLPLMATSTGVVPGIAGVAYSDPDGDSGLVITVMPGSDDRWRATFAAAETVEHTTVRGRDAVIADFSFDVTEVSWLEADGTLVRLNTVRSADIALGSVLDQLTEIDAETFSTLVDETLGSETFSEQGTEISRETPQATPGRQGALIEVEDADSTYRATLVLDEAGGAILETSIDEANSGSSSSSPVESLEASTAVRDTAGGREMIVAGIIGPDVARVDIVDPATGTVIEGSGPSIATIEGSDHVLFMGLIDDQWSDRDLVVVGTRADGTTVELPV